MTSILNTMGLAAVAALVTFGMNAHAAQVTTSVQTDYAEICDSVAGDARVARTFGPQVETYFIQPSAVPGTKPTIKTTYTYAKSAQGTSVQRDVETKFFELMIEPFGGVTVPQTSWLGTYEIGFDGTITVTDDKGTVAGTYEMQCNGAMLEYR